MRKQLRVAWESRAPRERMTLTVLAVAIVAAACLWLIRSGGEARQHLAVRVGILRSDAVRLQQHASEVERLLAALPASAAAAPATDLRTVLEQQSATAGLSRAPTKMEADGTDRVAVTFNHVAFADWSVWASSLQVRRIRIDRCRIEALPAPGMVNVSANLVRMP